MSERKTVKCPICKAELEVMNPKIKNFYCWKCGHYFEIK